MGGGDGRWAAIVSAVVLDACWAFCELAAAVVARFSRELTDSAMLPLCDTRYDGALWRGDDSWRFTGQRTLGLVTQQYPRVEWRVADRL